MQLCTYEESELILPKLKSDRLIENSCPLNDSARVKWEEHGNIQNPVYVGPRTLLTRRAYGVDSLTRSILCCGACTGDLEKTRKDQDGMFLSGV